MPLQIDVAFGESVTIEVGGGGGGGGVGGLLFSAFYGIVNCPKTRLCQLLNEHYEHV